MQHASAYENWHSIYAVICMQAVVVRTCLWTAAIVTGVLAALRIWLGITLPKQAKVHMFDEPCMIPPQCCSLAARIRDTFLSCMLQRSVAFFHPNANGGGGGERVLW